MMIHRFHEEPVFERLREKVNELDISQVCGTDSSEPAAEAVPFILLLLLI